MKIIRISPFSGKINTMNLPMSVAQLLEWHRGNTPIQEVMPELSPDEREFIMTGITPEEWAEL